MKVNVTIDDRLMKRIDEYADSTYMSRSGFISLCCSQYLDSQEAVGSLKELAVLVRKIADNGTVDGDTLKRLEDFERTMAFLLQK